MRLLHTNELYLKDFIGDKVPPYVVLSHTWGDEEITLDDIKSGTASLRKSYDKLRGACTQATRDGFEWLWIDTCCIDKNSSSDLQESINSMFQWYKGAHACFAYLADVPDRPAGWGHAFELSRWWTRGWTLQELLAPSNVEFYAADWSQVGTKLQRATEISRFTGIHQAALIKGNLTDYLAAHKMSWASRRSTSRAEDMAYALLGLFDVNMPLLYGEGGPKAFRRLQEEILKQKNDHSLFLWSEGSQPYCLDGLLCDSPARFSGVSVRPLTGEKNQYHIGFKRAMDYSKLTAFSTENDLFRVAHASGTGKIGLPATCTSRGLRISLWLFDLFDDPTRTLKRASYMQPTYTHIALLNVQIDGKYIGIYLRRLEDAVENLFCVETPVMAYVDGNIDLIHKPKYEEIYIIRQAVAFEGLSNVMRTYYEAISPSAVDTVVEMEPTNFVVAEYIDPCRLFNQKWLVDECGRLHLTLSEPHAWIVLILKYHQATHDMEQTSLALGLQFFTASDKIQSRPQRCKLRAALLTDCQPESLYNLFAPDQSQWDHAHETGDDCPILETPSGRRFDVGIKLLAPSSSTSSTTRRRSRERSVPAIQWRLRVHEIDHTCSIIQSYAWCPTTFWQSLTDEQNQLHLGEEGEQSEEIEQMDTSLNPLTPEMDSSITVERDDSYNFVLGISNKSP